MTGEFGLIIIIGFISGVLAVIWLNFRKLKHTLEQKEQDYIELQQSNKDLQNQVSELDKQIVVLDMEKKNLESLLSQYKEEINNTKSQFKLEFENLANKIFEDKQKNFNESSKASLDAIVQPLQRQFKNFEQKVDASIINHNSATSALRQQLDTMFKTGNVMVENTKQLTEALKGGVKVQGNWGEVVLERILEQSGLQKGVGYEVQGKGLGLTDDSGRRQKPDVIVYLPENKHIIVDSKVSLKHYESYCSAKEELSRTEAKKKFLSSLMSQVNDLSSKNYQSSPELSSPDFVLLFMPVEGAYSFALQEDRDLYAKAWDKKIVLVSPTTLFVALRTISSCWQLVQQNDNAQKIAEQGGKLYDKIAGFFEDMSKIGVKLTHAQESYASAVNKLHEGKGSILTQTKKLKEMGLTTKKSLPQSLPLED